MKIKNEKLYQWVEVILIWRNRQGEERKRLVVLKATGENLKLIADGFPTFTLK